MFKAYQQTIYAVQWDGTKEMLKKLQQEDWADATMWVVNGTSLRISKKQTQGDYYVIVGDYLIKKPEGIFHYDKKHFEHIYNKV